MAFHETIAADEVGRFEEFARDLGELQRRRAQKTGAMSRALHLKQHVGAVGALVVDAAEAARVGVFATNGRVWPVYARFSNGSSAHQADKAPDVRGLALKLVGVSGRKIIAGLETQETQDFLFIDQPAIPFRDPDEFMTFVRAAKDGPLKLLPRLVNGFGLRRAIQILRRSLGAPKVASFATHTFHAGAPISFGASAAKLALVPIASPVAAAGTPAPGPAASGADALRADLVARLRAGPLAWSLRAQLFQDDSSTPIEDTSVAWSGPWVALGTLTLPRQDPESAQGREIAALVEKLSFDPWHALEAHRPLGAIMRARAAAYRVSVIGRKAAPEPTSVIGL
jgi:Catalase